MTDTTATQPATGQQGWTIESSRLISEMIDGETIVIDTISGAYFSLDLIASHVWAVLEKGVIAPDAIVACITTIWPDDPVTVRSDVLGLLATLAANMLIVAMPDPVEELTLKPLIDDPAPYATPTVAKYTDMEELLLIDPIHDVDPASGWPVARPDNGDR